MDSKICLLICLLSCSLLAGATNHNSVNLTSLGSSKILKVIQDKLVMSYAEIGHKVNFLEVTPGRGVGLANSGELDGVSISSPIIEATSKNLVRVPVKLLSGDLTLYCSNNVTCDESVLDDERTIVGIISNVRIMLVYMQGKRASTYSVANVEQMKKLFDIERIKYVLSLDIHGFGNIIGMHNEYPFIRLKNEVFYHYLHKRKQDIVEPLTSKLSHHIEELGFGH